MREVGSFALRSIGSVVLVTAAYFLILFQDLPILYIVSDSAFTLLRVSPALAVALVTCILWPGRMRRLGPALLAVVVFGLVAQQHLTSAANAGLTQKVWGEHLFRQGTATPFGAAVVAATAMAYGVALAASLARLVAYVARGDAATTS